MSDELTLDELTLDELILDEFIDESDNNDDFFEACKNNDIDKVEKIMNKNNCDDDCGKCMHKIIGNKYFEIAEQLILRNNNYIYLENDEGLDCYAFSCYMNSFNLIKLILNIDENINNNAYGHVDFNSLMMVDDLEIFKYLLDKSNINHLDIHNFDVLMVKLYIDYKNLDIYIKMAELLIKKGANIYHKDYNGETNFGRACKFFRKDVLELLLLNNYDYEKELNELSEEKFYDVIKKEYYTYEQICQFIKEIDDNIKMEKSSYIFSLIVCLNDSYFNIVEDFNMVDDFNK